MHAAKAKTEIRQDQIARAALELMLRHGWKKVSIAAIARKVGVVPSNVYRHYKSKEEVLDAVLDLVGDQLAANVQAVRQESDDALERLRSVLSRHVRLVRGEIPVPRVVFSEEAFSGSSPRRRKVYQIFKGYLDGIAEVIREGQECGQIRTTVAAAELAVMFLGLVQPAAILWVMSNGQFDIDHQVEAAWQVFSRAIHSKQ